MKKILFYAAAVALMASCAESDLVQKNDVPQAKNGQISFVRQNKNMTRSYSDLQTQGHYNFGVFAYKSTDKVNNIMENYLVGYYDDDKAYSTSGTTVGDQGGLVDGLSYWMYEGLGWGEFTGTYAGQRLNTGDAFASNVKNQYLRYWDKAADNTYFYAYAPYVNTVATGKTVTYVDGQEVGTSTDKYVMTIPNGTIKHATVEDNKDYSLYEFMYASTKIGKANYGHDVALNFKRLNAKVNIKFWEDIPGYNVRMINLTNDYSISAVPSIYAGPGTGKYGYKLGKIYSENGAKIQFSEGVATGTKQYEGTTVSTPINFKAPTAASIGENRLTATPSTTTYFAIPKGSSAEVLANGADKYTDAGTLDPDLDDTGLTFHVSYELVSTTGEVITVKDATVHVPVDYTNWKENTHYTYIFKITTNSNGSTDSEDDPNPIDPEVPTEPGLYPIVFDNCTVEDWEENESEWEITQGTHLAYHDVQLSDYSVMSGSPATITVSVTDNDTFDGHAIDLANVTVAGPDAADENDWYDGAGTITVPATATAGVYTVTYSCNPAGLQYDNHPNTWTETFVVGHSYSLWTNLSEIGTNRTNDDSKLWVRVSVDGGALITPSPASGLYIEYPENVDKDKVKVVADAGLTHIVVDKNAAVGKYKLVYTVKVDGADVKVDEKEIEVKDYQFSLDYKTVYNKVGGTTITATALPTTPNVDGAAYTVTGGFSVVGNTIVIPNNTEEGEQTVTLTVNGTSDSKAVYTATFNVQNTYDVTLSKNTLQRDLGRANDAAQGSDEITIYTKKNGVNTATDLTSALKIKLDGVDVTSNFTIDHTSANEYTLKVNKEAAVNKVYTVEYTGQSDKIVTAEFTVQK